MSMFASLQKLMNGRWFRLLIVKTRRGMILKEACKVDFLNNDSKGKCGEKVVRIKRIRNSLKVGENVIILMIGNYD